MGLYSSFQYSFFKCLWWLLDLSPNESSCYKFNTKSFNVKKLSQIVWLMQPMQKWRNLLPFHIIAQRSWSYWCLLSLKSQSKSAKNVEGVCVWRGGGGVWLGFWECLLMTAIPCFRVSESENLCWVLAKYQGAIDLSFIPCIVCLVGGILSKW